MQIFETRIKWWQFLIGGLLLVLTAAVLWFSFFRLEWMPRLQVPENYDFTSELDNLAEPSFAEREQLLEIKSKFDEIDVLINDKDDWSLKQIFINSSDHFDDLNMVKRNEVLKKQLDRAASYELLLSDVQTLLESRPTLYFGIDSENELEMGYALETVLNLFLLSYVKKSADGDIIGAEQRLSVAQWIALQLIARDKNMNDVCIEQVLSAQLTTQHLTNFSSQTDSRIADFMNKYAQIRPSFKACIQAAKLETEESFADVFKHIDRSSGIERFLASFYVNQEMTEKNMRIMWYGLIEESQRENMRKELESLSPITIGGGAEWRGFLYKDPFGLLMGVENGLPYVDDEHYRNELKKMQWLSHASLAYIAVWRYQKQHGVFPENLDATNFRPPELEEWKLKPIFYRCVSDQEFYIMSTDTLDVSIPSELEQLMYEHAYWYYKEEAE